VIGTGEELTKDLIALPSHAERRTASEKQCFGFIRAHCPFQALNGFKALYIGKAMDFIN
jgi:hypothetical protein